MSKEEIIFADGLKITNPFPDLYKLNINVEKFVNFLSAYKNEKGYVNVDICKSKTKDAYYAKLNTWQPKKKQQPKEEEFIDDEIPF